MDGILNSDEDCSSSASSVGKPQIVSRSGSSTGSNAGSSSDSDSESVSKSPTDQLSSQAITSRTIIPTAEADDEVARSRSPSPAPSDASSVGQKTPSPQEIRHECEMPITCPNLGSKLYYVKLPNFLSINTREYDPATYEDEIDEDEQLDNEGRARLKLKVENTIRWRKVEDSDGNIETQSNARIVEWSDGTMSLYLGSEIFDVNEKPMGECSHLYTRRGTVHGLQGQAIFNAKLSIRPNSTESLTHRKLTLSLADRSQKTLKIRMLNNPGQDPEARLNELSKKEDDKMKATLRRESKQRRMHERSQTRGPSSSYLENDYDDEDDEGAISLSAIKRGAMSRKYADDMDDSEDEDEYSDDSDPEFGKVQRNSERKTKKVVEDSDDED